MNIMMVKIHDLNEMRELHSLRQLAKTPKPINHQYMKYDKKLY